MESSDKAMADVFQRLQERGYLGRVVRAGRAHELQAELAARLHARELDPTLYEENLAGLTCAPPDDLPAARSLIVVAVPSPQTRLGFHYGGRAWPLDLPPTYAGYRVTGARVRDFLAEVLAPWGHRVVPAPVPNKLLAARSGLAFYGRNNICYVPGMGSFVQLVAAFSDLPCEHDEWHAPRMLERCGHCRACLRACPTGAITEARFLLQAGRCFTFHNERPADAPAWIDPEWYRWPVGCMRCQLACPEDKTFRSWIEDGPEFTEAETARLLAGGAREALPGPLREKMERLDLLGWSESLDALARNLRMCMRVGIPVLEPAG